MIIRNKYLFLKIKNQQFLPVLFSFLGRTVKLLVSDRTQWILKQLGFEWQEITGQHIEKMLDHCLKVGFIAIPFPRTMIDFASLLR